MDDTIEKCEAIHARMKAQNLLPPWKELTASFNRNGLPVIAAQEMAEKLLMGNLLHAEGEQASDEVTWRWVLDNLTRALAEGQVDLLASAPSHKALAAVLAARANPKFAEELLMMDLKITRQRMERQNTRRFEDDGSPALKLVVTFRAGRAEMEAAT